MPEDKPRAAGSSPDASRPASLSVLHVVATPLGHLGDLSARAREVLLAVPVVACEDTRVTRRLLAHVGASPRLLSVREENEERGADAVIAHLAAGRSVAYCSDAGTPGVSDPGLVLVRRVREAGFRVEPVPGPSALAAALSVAGLPSTPCYFAGFLPSRPRDRRSALAELAGLTATLVFYEAPHRMAAFLEDALAALGPREVVIGRELTKRHEEILAGRLGEVPDREWRGELTVVVAGCGTEGRGGAEEGEPGESLEAWIRRRRAESPEAGTRELAREAARVFAIPARDAYRAVLDEEAHGDSRGEEEGAGSESPDRGHSGEDSNA